MKDKRNCSNNMNYPIYQQPMMVPPMGYPNPFQGNVQMQEINSYNAQINNLEQQIKALDQRVSRLESLTNTQFNNSTKYSDSNYYMV